MAPTDLGSAPARSLVLAAFAAVYLIWGSTYLAILFAIETLPPLLMAGARFLAAGAILYAVMRLRGVPAPAARHWRAATIVGGLLLLFGNGGVVLAERTVPSGVVALLVALVPAWMAAFEWMRRGGLRPTARVMVGVAVGFAGTVLLVGPAELAGAERVDPYGTMLVLVGSMAWAAGSIYSRTVELPSSPLLTTAMQMLAGGALLAAAGLVSGEALAVDAAGFSTRSVLAFVYLVVFGSLVGYPAYTWLLRVSTPARVSTYAYVNPVVAVFLGWWLAGEPMTPRVLVAAAVIVAAVVVITTGGRPAARAGSVAGAGAGAGGGAGAGTGTGAGTGAGSRRSPPGHDPGRATRGGGGHPARSPIR
jgi:drug/metabolite transporter (DMT)-like permease